MSLDLVTYSGDRRMDLAIAECIRKPVWGDDWTRVRIGLQLNFPGATAFAANLTGTPTLAFGVCSGDLSGFGAGVSGSTTHAAGFITNPGTSWSYGSNAFLPGSVGLRVFKKVGTTLTISSNVAAGYLSGLDSARSGIFVEIYKGAPTSYTFHVCMPSSAAGAVADLTDNEFIAFMEMAAGMASPTTVKANYITMSFGTLSIDEGTNGTLDNIFVHWDKSVLPLSFNIRHRILT